MIALLSRTIVLRRDMLCSETTGANRSFACSSHDMRRSVNPYVFDWRWDSSIYGWQMLLETSKEFSFTGFSEWLEELLNDT
jgi:hypothetical protein